MRPSLPECLCVMLLCGAIPCPAQTPKPTIIPLVPAANWQLVRSETVSPDRVRGLGGDPAVSREYGVKTVEHRVYRLRDKTLDVFLEQASDPSAAYGLFT